MENKAMDPVTLEVIWNRFMSVANEQQDTLIRTAFSTIVRESQDLACGLFDTRGRMIAQSLSGTPGHINAMATSMKHFLAAFPPDKLSAGDVLITNDPWQTAGQINDITITTPIFRNGKLVALFANTCHSADIGGRILSAEAREVFEEGLRIPIMKLFERGEPNQILMQIVRANVRQPDEVIGDFYAQTACNETGGRALLEMMDEFELDSIDAVAEEIIRRSEAAVRAEIRKLPNGEWTNETWSDGFEEPIVVRCTVKVAGDEIFIDFTGSSPQSTRGINVVLNYTHAYASFAIKAAICPDVPHNEGSFRPVHVSAPPGSILNALDPAPVASRQVIGHFIPSAIFAALSGAMPGRLDGARRRSDLAERLARAESAVYFDGLSSRRHRRASDKGRLERRRFSQRRRRRAGGGDREFVAGGHEAAPAPTGLRRPGRMARRAGAVDGIHSPR